MARSPIRLLVCGGRDFADEGFVFNWLSRFAEQDAGGPIGVLIHGGATGADRFAADWGHREGFKVIEFKANWRKYGKRAGPLRNARMIEEGKPDAVIAFSGGRGTANMVALARASGIRVIEVAY